MSASRALLLALLTRLNDGLDRRSKQVDFFGPDGPLAKPRIESNVDIPCGCYDERGALGYADCPKHSVQREVAR
jgi:hypothetical protein